MHPLPFLFFLFVKFKIFGPDFCDFGDLTWNRIVI